MLGHCAKKDFISYNKQTTSLFLPDSISLLRPTPGGTPGNRGSNPVPSSQESAGFATRPHRPTYHITSAAAKSGLVDLKASNPGYSYSLPRF
jgi:hypothetical protein